MKAESIQLSFDDHVETKKFVLELFGKTVDKESYVVEKDNPGQKVLTPRGDEIRVQDFAGVIKGSQVFIRSDVDSLIEAADRLGHR